MICEKCGTEIDENGRFCPFCGNEISSGAGGDDDETTVLSDIDVSAANNGSYSYNAPAYNITQDKGMNSNTGNIKSKKVNKKIFIISGCALLAVLVISVVVIQLYNHGIINNVVSSFAKSQPLVSGACGDTATFEIRPAKDYDKYELSIYGSGTLWPIESIDFGGVAMSSIKYLTICGNIETDYEGFSIFEFITDVKFTEDVTHIYEYACSDMDRLENVTIENKNCKIDYWNNNEGYYNQTLGDAYTYITIFCKKDSMAEEYFMFWNNMPGCLYSISYI